MHTSTRLMRCRKNFCASCCLLEENSGWPLLTRALNILREIPFGWCWNENKGSHTQWMICNLSKGAARQDAKPKPLKCDWWYFRKKLYSANKHSEYHEANFQLEAISAAQVRICLNLKRALSSSFFNKKKKKNQAETSTTCYFSVMRTVPTVQCLICAVPTPSHTGLQA